MQEPEGIRSDRVVVIGFTGPIGSGRTTVSKFLAKTYENQKWFFHFLFQTRLINRVDEEETNDYVYDFELEAAFANQARHEELARSPERLADAAVQDEINTKIRNTHNRINSTLAISESGVSECPNPQESCVIR
jgi:deoxyadenosine/deoxycytidine kinase